MCIIVNNALFAQLRISMTNSFDIALDIVRFHPHPELSSLCDRMWDADKNRLTPGVHYKIDPQGKTRFHSRQDHARDPLFTFVDPSVFQRETYKSKCSTFYIMNYQNIFKNKICTPLVSVGHIY